MEPTTSSPTGLSREEARDRLVRFGPNEIPEPRRRLALDFARRFWGPVPWMLEGALALELVLGKVAEPIILLALLVFNAVLAQVQDRRAQVALDLLRHRLRVTARVLRGSLWTSIPARDVVPGDVVHLRMGDVVPADCRVLSGDAEVDQATLTGESAPVPRSSGATLFSSSIVRRGDLTAEVTATGARSFYGKTAELVRSAQPVSHLEGLLFRIVRYLATLDVIMAAIVIGIGTVRGVSLAAVVPFVLILIIASVPVALPTTFTIANAFEARLLVEQGVLVTGLTAVQDAASMEALCIDKTGTLTEGKERVGDVVSRGAQDPEAVLALASCACDESTGDVIDIAILDEARRRRLKPPTRTRFVPFDPSRKRSEATVLLEGGERRVVLGSPEVVGELCHDGSPELAARVERLSAAGGRVLAVASGDETGLELVGLLSLSDRPRDDAARLVRDLHEMGIRVVMLTGDTLATARRVAEEVGIGTRIGGREDLHEGRSAFDGFAGIYPEDKFRLVESLQGAGHVVGMTGDGVNDAPALKQADVGIAVSSATDVARASAKLVLTRPGLTDIVSAVQGGRRTYRRMLTWTLNKISKNLEQVLLLTAGFVAAGIFVTTPFLILLLVFANDFVSMSVGGDRARVSSAPDRWDVREIVAIAAVVGLAWLAVSFGLLWWALDIAHLSLGAVQTFFFVYLVFGSQGTVLLVRESDHAWRSRPSLSLLVAIVADLAAVTVLAVTGVLMPARLPLELVLGLLGIVAVAAFAVDFLKVFFIRWSGAFGPRSRFARRDGSRAHDF